MAEETWEQKCERHPAWERAVEFYIENGTHNFVMGKAQRCVTSGKMAYMDNDCWTALVNAYPA